MKIGAISDTHLWTPDPVLDYILDELLGDTDLIVHAGDIVSRRVLERLEESNVLAVCGNMDDYEVAGILPQTRVIPVGGIRIGLMHGWGAKEGLAQRIVGRFADRQVDLIVYGHSHVPFSGVVQGVPMFNPGAASSNRYTGSATVGVIDIRDGEILGSFLSVDR
jgi:uncharacterized protein